jgi:hypothetical protein
MFIKIIYTFFSALFLIYLLMPGPSSIYDLPDLPNSMKSTLEGDTIQVPNVKGFFSDNYRDFATGFYRSAYQKTTLFPFPPLRLNYPPEYAFTAIKDQTESTYLEEYVYPLRDSLYVNGLEPFDSATKKGRFTGATYVYEDDNHKFETKVTLRYYPSPMWARVLVWMGINISLVAVYVIGKKVFKYG